MTPTDISTLLERIRQGRTTIILGSLPPLASLPADLAFVRVRCDLPTTLGPLERARRRIDHLLDGGERDREQAAARLMAFADRGTAGIEERFVLACNRLAARAPGHAAVVLDAVDAADAGTHRALARLLSEPGRLLVPLVLVLRDAPRGSILEVIEAIRRASGAEAAPAAELQAPPPPADAPARVSDIVDPRALRVLRAAAVAGPAFEASALARLLDIGEQEVLESLQLLHDAGVPVADDAEGHFRISEELRASLVATTLPSLQRHWHRVLGGVYGEGALPDPLRSAAHLGEAGERERAIERRLEAVAMLARTSDLVRASAELASTKTQIAALPRGPFTATMRARAKLETARVAWLGGDTEPTLTLTAALETAIAARAELGAIAPAALRSDAAATIAGIAYDLGDGAALERAEAVVSETVQELVREAAMVEAATLLNDQAALALRMGQLVRALDLLGRSRELLTAQVTAAPGDLAARADLAATHHLLARLPLHGSGNPISPQAIAGALEHASLAEGVYRELAMRRDLGHVHDTRARLEAKRGDVAKARAAFGAAFEIADEAGDLTGLARTAAGLAELLSTSGAPQEAVDLLVRSIELNQEKGSPIGLAFDEGVLGAVEHTLEGAAAADPALRAALTRARVRLSAAVAATS